MNELICHSRRLHRFRCLIARQKTYHDIARRIVLCDVYNRIRERGMSARQGEEELKRALAYGNRIVICGDCFCPDGHDIDIFWQ